MEGTKLYKMIVYLYPDPTSKTLSLSEIADYLKKTLQLSVEIRGDFFHHFLSSPSEEIAKSLAAARIKNPNKFAPESLPLYGEIEYEKKALKESSRISGAIFYDGNKLNEILRSLIPASERDFEHLHLVFTKRLFGTYDETDRRWHARVLVLGYPTIISTTGIVEAPAKPKEFYQLKYENPDIPLEVLKEKFQGRFLDYDDPPLTEVMKGYALQAIFYSVFGEPFCKNKTCRLYDAHWQEEVIHSQITSGKLCPEHKKKFFGIVQERMNTKVSGG